TFPTLELHALWRLKRGESTEAVLHARNTAFQRTIPDRWIDESTHVIGFDTSSWLLAQRCTAMGRPFLLDQSIGHARTKERLYKNLRERFPEWADTIPKKSEDHLYCEDQEQLAAHIIVVPSTFVRDTLTENHVPPQRIRVIPFGTDTQLFNPAKVAPTSPMVFLYAGSLTARKGLPVLLDAWQQAALGSRAELWLAGPGSLPPSVAIPNSVRLLGPLSRIELARVMHSVHVFVCPSFFEGLAQVQIEALASGVPFIGTSASGAADIVLLGQTG